MNTDDKQVIVTLIVIVLFVFVLSGIKSCHQEKNPDVISEEYVIPYDEWFFKQALNRLLFFVLNWGIGVIPKKFLAI